MIYSKLKRIYSFYNSLKNIVFNTVINLFIFILSGSSPIFSQTKNIDLLTPSTDKLFAIDLNNGKRIRFYVGDAIALKVNKKDTLYKGRIELIEDSAIWVDNIEVKINTISKIYDARGRRWASFISSIFFRGGIGFLLIDVVNRTINSEDPILHPTTLLVSGSAIGAGLLLVPFKEKKYRISNKTTVKIIDLKPN